MTIKHAFCALALLTTAASAQEASQQAEAAASAAAAANPASYVEFETTLGAFTVELYPDKAPQSVANFLQYVADGFYEGTIFHRIIGSFVIQGGGYTADFTKKPTREPVINEADNMLPNQYGTLAMARTANPHSATSQFYINVANNMALNHSGKTDSRAWGYAVFGRVIAGEETIEAMRSVTTGPGGPFRTDVPSDTIEVTAVRVVEAPTAPTP
ncbi:MAG: peptidylprolyl isomerase [Pseudomonadota bacterium]